MPAKHMVFSHQILFLDLDFVEDLPNPFCIKLLDALIKTETKKNLHPRRLDFDGNWNVIASRLVFLKASETEKEGVNAISKCDQPDGSTHLPMHLCFSQDDAHSTP